MKYCAKLAGRICLVTSVVFGLTALFYSTIHFVIPAHAERAATTGTISSSPASGPVDTTISVSGSGWPDPDGEQVALGYMLESNCLPVSNAQTSTFKNGSFSGSLQLPNGTTPGTYSICAMFGKTTAVANTFTVLTDSSPQIRISLPMQPGEQQATVSGSNYLPSGTTVNLNWETTNGTVIFTITPAISNSNGHIARTFLIPASLGSGSYKIVATITGQPALTAAATFTYNVPTPTPTPTPTATATPTALPVSDPTPAKLVSPTAVATTAVSTPTTGATSLVGSQNTNTGQPPLPETTSNTTSPNRLNNIVLIGSVAGASALLAIILPLVFLTRRKKARSQQIAVAIEPTQNGFMTWQNSQFGGTPFPIHDGSMTISPPWPATSAPSQQPLQISPYTHLLQQTEGESSNLTSEPAKLTLDDPTLESIKHQVQLGLFATPASQRDG